MNERTLSETFLQTLVKNIVAPVATKAVSDVTASPAVQAALVQAQDAARKAEVLAWALGLMATATFIFFVIPRMEVPYPRALRRGRA